MAETKFKGSTVNTVGDLPAVGSAAPDFTLTGSDLSDVTLADQAGRRVVLNIFPSIDTGVCATSVRTFNQKAASLDNTTVVGVSADLPFALSRFCAAEGIENVATGSVFSYQWTGELVYRLAGEDPPERGRPRGGGSAQG